LRDAVVGQLGSRLIAGAWIETLELRDGMTKIIGRA